MLKDNYFITVIIVLISLVIGIIFGILLTKWNIISPFFFQIKITEIAQIFVTILIAIFITFLVNKKTSNEFQQKKILKEIVDKLTDEINVIYILGIDYIENKDKGKETKIKRSLKNASATLSILLELSDEVCNSKKEFSYTIKNEFFQFKKALTDSPFGQSEKAYTSNVITLFESKSKELFSQLYKYKIILYK